MIFRTIQSLMFILLDRSLYFLIGYLEKSLSLSLSLSLVGLMKLLNYARTSPLSSNYIVENSVTTLEILCESRARVCPRSRLNWITCRKLYAANDTLIISNERPGPKLAAPLVAGPRRSVPRTFPWKIQALKGAESGLYF